MNVIPSFSRLIIKPTPKETTTPGGLHIPTSAQNEDISKGTITAVCGVYMAPNGPISHSFKVGQMVFYQQNKNTVPVNIEGDDYEIVHIDNVEAVVTG